MSSERIPAPSDPSERAEWQRDLEILDRDPRTAGSANRPAWLVRRVLADHKNKERWTMTAEQIINTARWTYFVWAWRDIGKAIATPYSVTLWGSHPDEQNDDCHTGEDYATNKEASSAFIQTVGGGGPFDAVYYANWMYIQLDGPDIHLIAKNPQYSAKRARREMAECDAEWRSERAMQAGMAFGCDGYNDEMGW